MYTFRVITFVPPLQWFPSYFYYLLLHFPNFPYFQFHIFFKLHISNFLDIFPFRIFKISILPIFPIFSNFIFFYISHTSSFPDIFKLHIFHISHTSNFPNIFQSSNFLDILSHIQIVSILSSHSILPLVSYFIAPQFTIYPNFLNRTSCVSFQLCSLHFTSQLYTFFPLSPFFNLLPAPDILALQCSVRGLVYVPEVLNVHKNKIHKELTTFKLNKLKFKKLF